MFESWAWIGFDGLRSYPELIRKIGTLAAPHGYAPAWFLGGQAGIATGHTTQVTDLGRAMITGKCADVGKTKGPILRGLSARAPFFHNGGAKTLDDVVEFYNQRFTLGLSDQQKQDLAAFLASL